MTGDEQGYNGWANYETWCMALWIDNDEGSYEYARELVERERGYLAEQADGMFFGTREEALVGNVARALEAWKDEAYEQAVEMVNEVDGFLGDFLGSAWGQVDWYEIAATMLSETEDASV